MSPSQHDAIPVELESFCQRFLEFATVGGELFGSCQMADDGQHADALVAELVSRTPDAVVLRAHALVAQLGSVLVDLAELPDPASAFTADAQVLIATADKLVPTLADGLAIAAMLGSTHSLFISGPSRTADVEKTLVCPAHGPKETHLVIIR